MLFFKGFLFLNNLYTQYVAWTPTPKIKTYTLHQPSQPAPLRMLFLVVYGTPNFFKNKGGRGRSDF